VQKSLRLREHRVRLVFAGMPCFATKKNLSARPNGAISGARADRRRDTAAGLARVGCPLARRAGLSPARKGCNRDGRTPDFLQRISAAIGVAFIAFHIATLSRWALHGGLYDPSRPFMSVAAVLRGDAAF
jgi:hypothetical protein